MCECVSVLHSILAHLHNVPSLSLSLANPTSYIYIYKKKQEQKAAYNLDPQVRQRMVSLFSPSPASESIANTGDISTAFITDMADAALPKVRPCAYVCVCVCAHVYIYIYIFITPISH